MSARLPHAGGVGVATALSEGVHVRPHQCATSAHEVSQVSSKNPVESFAYAHWRPTVEQGAPASGLAAGQSGELTAPGAHQDCMEVPPSSASGVGKTQEAA